MEEERIEKEGKVIPMAQYLPPKDPFHTAAEQFARIVSEDPKRAFNREWQLVHGECMGPDEKPYADAWLETKNYASWFGTIKGGHQNGKLASFYMEKPLFHEQRGVTRFLVYDWETAMRLAGLFDHIGPFDAEIAKLPLLTGPRKSKIIFLGDRKP